MSRRKSLRTVLLAGALLIPAAPVVAQSVDEAPPPTDSRAGGVATAVAAADFPAWTPTAQTANLSGQVTGVSVHPESGNLLIGSRGNTNLRVVDPNGLQIGLFLDGLIQSPEGIETHNDEIYVTEAGIADRVSVWSFDGTPRRSWGSNGSGNGQFDNPCDVAISPTNEVYVLDASNDRVQVFDINGIYQRQWGTTGSGNGELDLFCTHSAIEYFEGEIFVTDTANHRIQVFDPSGIYLRQWGSQGSANGQLNTPTGLDIAAGMVYVADFLNDRIQVFTIGGVYQGTIPFTAALTIEADPAGSVLWATNNNSEYATFTNLKCSGEIPTHVGSQYPEDFSGTSEAEIVHLGGGGDRFSGLGGNDVICGGGGNDILRGNGGADTVNGGQGRDTLYGGDGNDSISGQGGNDKAFGAGGRDTLNGNEGRDTLNGGVGLDVANGGFGDDVLNGNSGNDTLRGGGRNDLLRGQAGADKLIGGDGSDECLGGFGIDTAQTCESVTGVP